MKTKIFGRSFAVCGDPEHIAQAVQYLQDATVRIRNVAGHENFKCFDDNAAVWYFAEVTDDD